MSDTTITPERLYMAAALISGGLSSLATSLESNDGKGMWTRVEAGDLTSEGEDLTTYTGRRDELAAYFRFHGRISLEPHDRLTLGVAQSRMIATAILAAANGDNAPAVAVQTDTDNDE